MVSEQKTAFALRMPPKVKEAARALASAPGFYEWSEGVTTFAFHGGSLNEAINSLLILGLKSAAALIDGELAENQEENRQEQYDRFHSMMEFLLKNPAASHVLPENLPEGSKAREWLREVLEQWAEEGGEASADRSWVADEYANAQRAIHQLTAAKGAIQRALA